MMQGMERPMQPPRPMRSMMNQPMMMGNPREMQGAIKRRLGRK